MHSALPSRCERAGEGVPAGSSPGCAQGHGRCGWCRARRGEAGSSALRQSHGQRGLRPLRLFLIVQPRYPSSPSSSLYCALPYNMLIGLKTTADFG